MIAGVLLVALACAAMALADLWWALSRKRTPRQNAPPSTDAASVVIPNWNGRDLLEKYLPSVIAAIDGNPRNEIIVVDNGSTDGSAEFVRTRFPGVRLLALDKNLGFGGGSNAGFRAARNDIVVLLNSDMRVAVDFLAPLLAGFASGDVFAVSCQIFFSDPSRRREETGLTQFWWHEGRLRVRHRDDPAVTSLFPCAYGGGGSCAFDRRKFLELGGFDELLAPFYLEDTDLGYLAWKRGWKVLYQPASRVWHEHRGTIGKRFSAREIDRVLNKNFLLFAWKNMHRWRTLAGHFAYAAAGATASAAFGESRDRTSIAGLWRAVGQLRGAMRSRLRARRLAVLPDEKALNAALGGYCRDTELASLARRAGNKTASPANVLFVSPYPICPPVHGGGVFMYQTVCELVKLCRLHLVIVIDHEHERAAHAELEQIAASVQFFVRPRYARKEFGSAVPHAVREFASDDLRWILHRTIYNERIDVVQLEYTSLAQYREQFQTIPCILFEHDLYFQSVGRAAASATSAAGWKAAFEYLRALRYELKTLPRFDRVQVCSGANKEVLLSYLPQLAGRIDDDLRAGVDTSRYEFRTDGREPFTMLFLGSFRHTPNEQALTWFTREVLPLIRRRNANARLVVVGSHPPPAHRLAELGGGVEVRGFVEDVREPLARYAVFICPILSGSGMRVKLLEAFAAGIPVVSTWIGAEGLAESDGEFCALADSAQAFARHVLHLFDAPEEAAAMAARAREMVAERHDMRAMTAKLADTYARAVAARRGTISAAAERA